MTWKRPSSPALAAWEAKLAEQAATPKPKLSEEQRLALRTKYSQPRKLPERAPVVVPPEPTPAELLSHLLATTKFTRKLYPRMGREALASQDPEQIERALQDVQAEAARLQDQANLVEKILPNLSKVLNAA
jgi:hypothetical protein